MPELTVKPSASFSESDGIEVLDSDTTVGGMRRGETEANRLKVYSLSFEHLTESEAQQIVDLFETVNYTQPFDFTVSSPEIDSAAYCIVPGSMSINILTGNQYSSSFQIELQYTI
jgi:hypothetical protein